MRLAFLKAIGLASAGIVAQAGPVQLPGLAVPASTAADRASVVMIFNESYSAYRYAQGDFRRVVNLWTAFTENSLLVMMRWRQ
jgi:hypothetical protein